MQVQLMQYLAQKFESSDLAESTYDAIVENYQFTSPFKVR
jgi:hypothetical protein